MSDLIRRRLGDFEVVQEIGRGGMGVVYEALQLSLHRRVALKVLANSLGLTPRAVERFHREAEAAAKLHHSNIVPVYSTGEHDGVHFYAMELIDGPSLDRVIRHLRQSQATPVGSNITAETSPPHLLATGPHVAGFTPPPGDSSLNSGSGYFDRVAGLIAGVADALEHAHNNGVIHRDIKPANLLLSPDGRLSLNDFGLARLLEQPGMTVTGEFVGTPAYMSPEQITAGRIPLDHRTDIYSLGATLYELLTLQQPFTAERRDQLLAQIVQKEPRSPRKVNKRVPVDLETICLKALDKDPDRRYQRAAHLGDDLRAFINRLTINARRAGVAHRLGKWGRRNPWLTASLTAVLVLFVLVAGLGYQGWSERRRHETADEAARLNLLDEKKKRAQQTVLQGNFEDAEAAINEAVKLGATAAWADWRRGQIAFHSGDTDKAIQLLNRAVPNLGDNMAATALLSLALAWGGSPQESPDLSMQMDDWTPRTVEDLLYAGAELSRFNPDDGLKKLDRAIERQRSVIGFALRAQVRADRAFDTQNLLLAQKAIDDANSAINLLPNNPAALCASAWTQLVMASLCAQKNQTSKRAEALARLRTDVDELTRNYPAFPRAVWLRGVALEAEGKKEEALKVWQEAVRKPDARQKPGARPRPEPNSLHEYRYAMALYRSGEVQRAADFAEDRAHKNPVLFMVLAWFLAEFPDRHDEAAENFRQFKRARPSLVEPFDEAIFLTYLGQKASARQAAARVPEPDIDRGNNPLRVFLRAKRAFLTAPGVETEKRLLAAAGGSRQKDLPQSKSRRNESDAYFLIGVAALAEGDRDKARDCFAKYTTLSGVYFGSYQDQWVRAFRARMEHDPHHWPRWLPSKK